MCVLARSSRPRVSAAVCVLRAQEWHPVVSKKTPNVSHAKRVSVPDPAVKSCVRACAWVKNPVETHLHFIRRCDRVATCPEYLPEWPKVSWDWLQLPCNP